MGKTEVNTRDKRAGGQLQKARAVNENFWRKGKQRPGRRPCPLGPRPKCISGTPPLGDVQSGRATSCLCTFGGLQVASVLFLFYSILFFFIKLIGVTSVNTVIQFSRVHYNSTSIRFCFNGRTGWVLKSGLEELADSSPVRSQGVRMCETPHPRPLPKHSSRPWFYFFASSGASPPRGVWSATWLSLDGALPLTTFFNLVSSSSQIFSIHIAGLLLLLVTFV